MKVDRKGLRVAEELATGLRRLVAPNPSLMTGPGTNTYLLGNKSVAVIDPGPAIPEHLEAILSATDGGTRISHILVTHAHLDHSELAAALARSTGAPVLAFGDATAGRPFPNMPEIEPQEGLDLAFRPDRRLRDGDTISTTEWSLTAMHTPGHLGGHLAFEWQTSAFSGDLAMGWSTTLVAPPDGDMQAYMASLDKLLRSTPCHLYPGHGDPVKDAPQRLAELLAHRRKREAQVLAVLAEGPATSATIADLVYAGLPTALIPSAVLSVLAHLIDLERRTVVAADGNIGLSQLFRLL